MPRSLPSIRVGLRPCYAPIEWAVTVHSRNVRRLPASPTARAPDGSDARLLLSTSRSSCPHFELADGQTSAAVVHSTVEEIWYVLSGRGQMWPASADSNGDVVDIMPGDCLTRPVDTRFQFRAHGSAALTAVAVTMPS